MEVTATGWLMVLVGLLSLPRPMWLTCLLLGSVTFSATAVANVPSVPFGMQPYHWFGMLLVVSTFVLRLPRLLRAATPSNGVNAALAAFLCWGIVATLATGAKGTSIAHMVHLVFGASVMACVVANTTRWEDRELAVRALVHGALLAAAWGVFELLCSVTGVPYPDWIFNNSVGEFVGTSTVLFFGIPRLSSVATEPSYLVRSLVPVLCLLMGVWLFAARTRLRVRLLQPLRWKVVLLVTIALLSTSSLGIVALFLASLVPLVFARRARIYIATVYALAAAAIGYLFVTNPLLASLADELLFGKLEYGSGTDRIVSVAEASEAFASSPIFGAGPGLVTSHDLLLKLLSNFGAIGAALFLLMLALATRQGLRGLSRARSDPRSALVLGLVGANLMLWTMDALAGVSYQYGIFWALLGLLISASRPPSRAAVQRSETRLATPPNLLAPGLDHHHRAQR